MMSDEEDCSDYEEEDEETKEEKRKKEEARGPFDIQSIDINIIPRILEKMNYTEYSRFEELCKFSAAACMKLKPSTTIPKTVGTIFINEKSLKISTSSYWEETPEATRRVPWNVAIAGKAQIKAAVLRIPHRITTKRLQSVMNLFKKNRTKIRSLILSEQLIFDPETLENLLSTTGIDYIKSHQFFPKQFFSQRIFDHLYCVDLGDTGFTNEEFLSLKWEGEMCCSNDSISFRGLNMFLHQWKRGEREIGEISIRMSGYARPFQIALEDLDANPIWSPKHHKDSLIGKIPISDYPPMETGDPFEFYSIWRSDDCFNSGIIVHLSMEEVQICKRRDDNEADYLLYELTDDQFYCMTGSCRYCYHFSPCGHRRTFSTTRFKLAFPRLWKGIMSTVTAAKWTATFTRSWQILMGAPRIPIQISMKEYMIHQENPQNNQILYCWQLLELYLFLF